MATEFGYGLFYGDAEFAYRDWYMNRGRADGHKPRDESSYDSPEKRWAIAKYLIDEGWMSKLAEFKKDFPEGPYPSVTKLLQEWGETTKLEQMKKNCPQYVD